jgi:hypothetical protein
LRGTQLSRINVVRINVFSENWRFNNLVVFFPFTCSVFCGMTKRVGSCGKLLIREIIITELFYSVFITFKRSHNISDWMIVCILSSKVELFSNFFQFSDIDGSVVNCAGDLNFFLGSNLRLFMLFRLLDWFFLWNRFWFWIWNVSIFDFAVNADTSYGANVLWRSRRRLRFFFFWPVRFDFNFRLDFGDRSNFRLYFYIDLSLLVCLIAWIVNRLVGLIIGLVCWWCGLDRLLCWLLFGFDWLLLGLSSGNRFHSASKEEIIHIFFEISPFSVGIERLLLVFWDLVVVLDSEAPSDLGHFLIKYLIKN